MAYQKRWMRKNELLPTRRKSFGRGDLAGGRPYRSSV